ncbi:MAG: ABC transporter permease [Erysipelotrichaceae bacterium]|nr:ABC transporter permease [Erysipelotrichaceae bacterium]
MGYLLSLKLSALLNSLPGGLAQGLVWGVMALGLYLTYRVLGFSDLSVDGSLATGGAVSVMLISAGVSPLLSVVAAFIAGSIAGLVTGLLHTRLGIPDILAGILTQISLYSINLNILGKANQAINIRQVTLYITSNTIYLTRTIIIMILVCLLIVCLLYWFLGTELGSSIRATGCNGQMARAQGINTDTMKVLTLMLANALVAASGALLSQYQGYADINMGRGAIVIGLAAIIIGEVIGEALLNKHLNFFGRLVFVCLGAVIYYLVYVFVIWLKFPPDDMKLLTAIVVAVFLAVPYLRSKSVSSFARSGKLAKAKGEK